MKRKIISILTACISLLVCLFGMTMPVSAETIEINHKENGDLSAELLKNPDFSSNANNWSSYNENSGTELDFYDGSLKVSHRKGGDHDGPMQDVTAAVKANGEGRYYLSAKVKFDEENDIFATIVTPPNIANVSTMGDEQRKNAHWQLVPVNEAVEGSNADSFRIRHNKTGLYLAVDDNDELTMAGIGATDKRQIWQVHDWYGSYCRIANLNNNKTLALDEDRTLSFVDEGSAGYFSLALASDYENGKVISTDGIIDTKEKRDALNLAEIVIMQRCENDWSLNRYQLYFDPSWIGENNVLPDDPMHFNICLEVECSDPAYNGTGKQWFSIYVDDLAEWKVLEVGDNWVTLEGYVDIWWSGSLLSVKWRPYTGIEGREPTAWAYNYLIDDCSLKKVIDTPINNPVGMYRLDFYNRATNDAMPQSYYVTAGDTVTLPNVPVTPKGKLGYWSLRTDGKYRRYEPGESYTVNSNTTFYFVTPTIDLTIAAETEGDVAQSFLYEITATNGFSMVVCVDANDKDGVTIYDLPAAVDYTVTELTAHSWRYTTATSEEVGGKTGDKKITVGLSNAVDGNVKVTFNHTNRNDKWLTDTHSQTLLYEPMFTVSHAITLHHQDDWYNLEVYNNGNIDIYVRMAITTHYVDGEGNISGAKGSWDSKLKDQALGDGWVEYGGFYYYTKPLTKWEVSEKLFDTNYTFPSADAGWMYSAQSVEAHPDALRNTWGVVISEGSVTDAP